MSTEWNLYSGSIKRSFPPVNDSVDYRRRWIFHSAFAFVKRIIVEIIGPVESGWKEFAEKKNFHTQKKNLDHLVKICQSFKLITIQIQVFWRLLLLLIALFIVEIFYKIRAKRKQQFSLKHIHTKTKSLKSIEIRSRSAFGIQEIT